MQSYPPPTNPPPGYPPPGYPPQGYPPQGEVPQDAEPPKTRKEKVKKAAVTGGLGVALIIYWLLFGFGADKDFTDKDLRACEVTSSEDCTSRPTRFRAQDMAKFIFTRANVSGLDMTGGVLRHSTMDSVIAEGTNFFQADFYRANLQGANLRGANLVEATFEDADLRNADLRGADLRGVDFRFTRLQGADLRDTVGGPACPSTFDRNLPDRFLNRAHCNLSQDEYRTACCNPAFGSTHVEGMRACLQPWWDLIREGQTQNYGVQGEVQYDNVLRIEDGRYICSE
jgi:hypothetical protein